MLPATAAVNRPPANTGASRPPANTGASQPPAQLAATLPLADALTALAAQSGADIISTEARLQRTRVVLPPPGTGVAAALQTMLAGTGFVAVPAGPNSWRVIGAADHDATPARLSRPLPIAPANAVATTEAEVIVTASKQRIRLLRFPGSLSIVDTGQVRPGPALIALDDVARVTPVLQSTELGTGRNKVFIRGIADSSFNGATETTSAVYFGDVQMVYSGTQPGLRLYDMARVEIMAGPQGTLYGAGAIGGIIRLTPEAPRLDGAEARIDARATATMAGNPGIDIAGMANLPIAGGRAALRAVAYGSRAGGYVDDNGRASNILGEGPRVARAVNQIDIVGGRLALAIEPGAGWRIDLSGLGQRITARDAQYAEKASGTLLRRSRLAQPYASDLLLGRVLIARDWDNGLSLLAATGVVKRRADDQFDASRLNGAGRPSAYITNTDDLLLTQELRLSRSPPGGISWVTGLALLYNRNSQSRALGIPDQPADLIGVTNVTQSGSLFAEITLPFTRRLAITLGSRITTARTDGEPSATPRGGSFVRGRSTFRYDPTLALSWLVAPRLAVFARGQTGYRTGGIAVARGVGRVADYRADSIIMGEAGLRLERRGARGVAFSASASYAHWSDIQADLFNARSQPFTANIGNADIHAIEASGDWVPLPGLTAGFALLYTENRVDGPFAASSANRNRRLPDTPPLAVRADLGYRWADRAGNGYGVTAAAHYVGRSVLGTGDYLDISQGQYASFDIGAEWQRGRLRMSIGIENLADTRANLFALGNPLTFTQRDQTVPLRPRTISIGASYAW